MTPDQHIAALQRIIVDAARYGGGEARAAIGMAIIGVMPDDLTDTTTALASDRRGRSVASILAGCGCDQ